MPFLKGIAIYCEKYITFGVSQGHSKDCNGNNKSLKGGESYEVRQLRIVSPSETIFSLSNLLKRPQVYAPRVLLDS